MGRIRVTLKKGLAGQTQRQRQTVRGLGLRRRHHTVELADTPEIRGMINKVQHLISFETIEGSVAQEEE